MTRALLVLVPLAAVAAALAGTALRPGFAVGAGVGIGSVVAAGLWMVQRRRVKRLADAVNRWLGADEHAPVPTPGGPAWRELAVAANALGASYARRGERLIAARRMRMRFVDAIDEPTLLFGGDGHLVRANLAARNEFGIPSDAHFTPGQTFGSAQLAGAVEEARDIGSAVQVDVALGERELRALAAPIGHETLVLITDRTERRLVDAVRRDFVANASHELKTPVSGIQALAEALTVTLERDPERSKALAARLDSEAQHLGKLVHDLLDLRRLEEAAPSDRAPVDLAALVESEVERVRPMAAERELTLTTDLPDRALVVASEEDVRLVVANLLDNAIGYNRQGGDVAVRLQREDGAWRLDVEDTGIGIARHDLDRIFERFYRVDVARSRATGGTGLGLSIVRHAVERHGGSVAVDSILGEGTTFHVVMPVEPRR